MTPDELRARIVEVLNTAQGPNAWGPHNEHDFSIDCSVCKGDVPALAERVMGVAGPLLGQLRQVEGRLAVLEQRMTLFLNSPEGQAYAERWNREVTGHATQT